MINRDNVMMVLSPRLLLEIDLTVQKREDEWFVRDGISASKYREFKRRSIQNAFNDILFSDASQLETGEIKQARRITTTSCRQRWFRGHDHPQVLCKSMA